MRWLFVLAFFLSVTSTAFGDALPDGEAVGHAKSTRHCYTATSTPDICKVTSLNNSGAGTLRDCVSTANTCVIFEVSGRIDLGGNLTISNDNIAVFGETAPTPGITLYGEQLRIEGASNIYVGHIGVLVDQDNTNEDGVAIIGSSNVYLRHVGAAWATDEILDLSATGAGATINTRVSNVTLDRFFGAEALTYSGGYGGGKGVLMGRVDGDYVTNVTVYKSLFVHNNTRNFKIRPGSSVEVINSFIVHPGDGLPDNFNLSADSTGETDNTNLDLVEGATILGLQAYQESSASDYVVDWNGTNVPGGSTQIHVDNWLHLDDWTSPGSGRRQSTGAGNNWDVVDNSTIPSGTFQSLSRLVSSSITEDTVDVAYNDVVSSDDSAFDGNVGPQPGTRINDTVQPWARIGLEVINLNTDSNARMKDCVEAASCADDAAGPPSYASNSRGITVVADPHGNSSKYSGFTNFEEQVHDDFRADVEPQTAPGADVGGTPSSTSNSTKVQLCDITFGATEDSDTCTITAVSDTTAAFPLVTNTAPLMAFYADGTSASVNNDDLGINVVLTNSTTVTASRLSTGTDSDGVASVAIVESLQSGEADGFVVREQGTISMAGATGSHTEAITGVTDNDQLVCFVTGCTNDNTTRTYDRLFTTARPSTSNCIFERDNSSNATVCGYAAVEFGSNYSVECGSVTTTSNAAAEDHTIPNSFDVSDWSTAWIYATVRHTSDTPTDLFVAVGPDSNTTAITTYATVAGADVEYCVVKHSGQSVEHTGASAFGGSEADIVLSSQTETDEITWTAVTDLTNSLMLLYAAHTGTGDSDFSRGVINYKPTSTTATSLFTGRTHASRSFPFAAQMIQFPVVTTGDSQSANTKNLRRGGARKRGMSSWIIRPALGPLF